MVLALQAESARLRGVTRTAHRLYQNAARRALEQEFPHHAALIQERDASLLESAGREVEAAVALAQAVTLYRSWGAHAAVARLTRKPDVSDALI